jgi:hypothetical protein
MAKLAQLKHPDPMHLKAAVGWIQLGDYDSANDELENIRAEWRAHPDVLELRWLIYSNDEQWDACLDIASAIVKMAPDRVSGWVDKAFSLRRANGGGIEKAKFRGIHKPNFYLHLKECEFRFNHRHEELYRILLKIFRDKPLKLS